MHFLRPLDFLELEKLRIVGINIPPVSRPFVSGYVSDSAERVSVDQGVHRIDGAELRASAFALSFDVVACDVCIDLCIDLPRACEVVEGRHFQSVLVMGREMGLRIKDVSAVVCLAQWHVYTLSSDEAVSPHLHELIA